MDKFTINLLPGEVLLQEKDRSKRSFLLKISVAFLLVVIMIAGATFLMRVTQKQQLEAANQNLDSAKAKVQSYSDRESLLVYLKQRLDNIQNLQGQQSKPVQSYYLMQALLPAGVSVSAFTLDKGNRIVISAQSSNVDSVKQFFDNLTDPTTNQKKITKVNIDSLSRTGDGSFRMDLTITTT